MSPSRGPVTSIPSITGSSPSLSCSPTFVNPSQGPVFQAPLPGQGSSANNPGFSQPGQAVFTPQVPPLQPARRSNIRLWLIAASLLVVLLTGSLVGLNYTLQGGVLGLFQSRGPGGSASGGSQATVDIIPASQDVKGSYQLSAITVTPNSARRWLIGRELHYSLPNHR